MKKLCYISLSLCFLTLCASGDTHRRTTDNSNPFANYKRPLYNLYIGQSLDSIDKVIELKYDYMADDGIVNTNGITHYMNIGEDLIHINGSDFLPALFFTTNKRLLTQFTCSIMFTPRAFQADSIYKDLTDIEPLFPLLNSVENKTTLAKTLKLNIETEGFEELFYFTTDGKYNMVLYYEKKKK